MAKYTSGRQKNLKVGLTSYSENLTSLEVIGNVGIATTNAGGRKLYVIGDGEFVGVVTSKGFYVDGELIGSATSLSQLYVSGLSTFAGITTHTAPLFGTQASFTGVVTSTTFNGQINAGVGTITILSGTTVTYNTGNFTNAYINTGVVTTLSGTNLSYTGISTLGVTSVTNLTARQLNVSGITTTNSLNIDATQVISSARQLQNIASLDATTTATIEAAIANSPNTFTDLSVTGISTLGVTSATNLTARQLNVSGLSTFAGITTHTASLFGTQALFTGVVTATTFNGQINAGVGTITTLSGTTATYDTGNFTTGNIVTGVVTTLTSTSATLTNINSSGISTLGITSVTNLTTRNINNSGIITTNSLNIGATEVISSARQLQNIASLDATTTATIEAAIANAPNTFTDLQVTGISTLGVTSATNLTSQQINVSGLSTFAGITTVTGETLFAKQLNVSGVVTATTFNGQINAGVGTITTLSGTTATYGTGNFTTGNIVTGVVTTLTSTNATLTNINSSGISTLGVTSATNLTAQQLNVSGVVTATTFNGQINAGVGTITTLNSTNATITNINSTGITTVGFLTATNIFSSGVVTATSFSGALTGIAASATQLVTPRTFEITGDVVATAISFDGTGNVSLAATIQPNSVALGSDTTGDYVQSVSGTSNQITVTGGTGESSTPVLSLPNNLVIPQDATVTRDLQVNRNLNVTGNITLGGTTAFINVQELVISDPDIILGYRTDAFGNDASNDNTANHGGVAVASTEGTPLTQLFIAGIETAPATYKKIMWFKAGTFAGLGTDAWLSNYAVGIGSTQFPNGTRLAAGSVQFTERDLAVVRNINASGITTSTGGFVGNLTGTASTASFATTAYNLTDAANIITGTINSARLTGTYNIDISGNASSATYATTAGVATNAQGLTGTPNITVANITASSLNSSGIVTGSSFRPSTGYYQSANGTNAFYVYDGTGNVAFQGTIGASQVNNASGFKVIGFAGTDITFENNAYVAGVTTSVGGFVGNLTGTATTATNLSNAANITTGTINSARLTGTYNIDISGNAATATSAGVATYATNAGVATYSTSAGIATYATNAGVATYSTSAGIATYSTSAGISTYATIAGVSTSVIGGIGSITQLNVSGVSTFGNNVNIAGTVGIGTIIDIIPYDNLNSGTLSWEGSAGQLFSITNNLTSGSIFSVNDVSGIPSIDVNADGTVTLAPYADGNVGIATTRPTSRLHVIGDGLIVGVLTATSFSGNASSATYATSAGVSTYATTAGVSTYATTAGIATYATTAGIATYATNAGVATYATSAGIATYATNAGIATNLKGGLTGNIAYQSAPDTTVFLTNGTLGQVLQSNGVGNAPSWVNAASNGITVRDEGNIVGSSNSVTTLNFVGNIVSVASTAGIATVTFLDYVSNSGVATTATNLADAANITTGIISSARLSGSYNIDISGNATTATTATNLADAANINTGTIDSARLSGSYNIDISGNAATSTNATYATSAGIATNATYATTAGIATYATTAGVSTYATTSGIATYATYATTAGIATYATTAGVSTYATTSGIATYATSSGIATYATTAGIATYATTAGVSTYATTSGTATYATSSGIATYATTAGIATYATTAGVSTNVIGGIASVTQLNVSGVSTLGIVQISSGIVTATSGIVTYYGDGSKLSGISITYVNNAGIATNLKGGAGGSIPYQSAVDTTVFLANGSPGQILQSNGGTTAPSWVNAAPSSAITGLTIRDEGTIVGSANSVSQLNFVGNIVSVASTAGIATVTFLDYVSNAGTSTSVVGGIASVTQLNVTGISTLGTVQISSGIVTATSGVVTYYGDGSKLTGISAGGQISVRKNTVQVGTAITTLDFTGPGISTITASSGIATITIPGSTRNVSTYIATAGQTSFSATYTVGYVDVYLNGAKLSETQYTATNGTTIQLIEGASLDDVVEIVGFSNVNIIEGGSGVGIATAGGTVGTGVTLLDLRGSGISTVTVSSGVATINITGGSTSSTPDISPVMMGMIF